MEADPEASEEDESEKIGVTGGDRSRARAFVKAGYVSFSAAATNSEALAREFARDRARTWELRQRLADTSANYREAVGLVSDVRRTLAAADELLDAFAAWKGGA